MNRKRVAVLISGRGSNMAALIEAAKAPGYPAEIVLVASNKPEAAGLTTAASAGIATAVVDGKSFAGKPAFEGQLNAELERGKVEIVCLAGFMRILSGDFVRRWQNRLINIHPSLLPHFPGLDTHARAIAAGHARHGCSVHFVTEGVDEGPVIAQAEVAVLPGDTPETLAERVLIEEHKLYPKALALVASGEVRAPTAGP